MKDATMNSTEITIHTDFEQGTPAWHEARAGHVTASNIHKLLTPNLAVADNATSRGLIHRLALERLTGHPVDAGATTYAMRRGTALEPYAREHYKQHYNPNVREVGYVERRGFINLTRSCTLGYSPDGLVDDDAIIEIKCPGPEKFLAWHEAAAEHEVKPVEDATDPFAGYVPPEHMLQVQAGIYTTGRSRGIFMAYTPGLAPLITEVPLYSRYVKAIEAAAVAAENRIFGTVAAFKHKTRGVPFDEWFDPMAEEEGVIHV